MPRNREKLRSSDVAEDDSINISPLIDVVFILLIFFIITTVFVEHTGLTVDRPEAASTASISQDALLLGLDANGQVYFAGQRIEMRLVRPTFERLLAGTDRPVIIEMDRQTPAQTIVRLLDQLNLAGATSLNIATRESNR